MHCCNQSIRFVHNPSDKHPVVQLQKGEITKESFAFSMDALVSMTALIPDEILPPYRKKRTYINSIMALNEVFKESSCCKEAFMRVRRGIYILNPDVEF